LIAFWTSAARSASVVFVEVDAWVTTMLSALITVAAGITVAAIGPPAPSKSNVTVPLTTVRLNVASPVSRPLFAGPWRLVGSTTRRPGVAGVEKLSV
jgi:hypothetical protein